MTLLFPQPLGPTMAEIPGGKAILAFSKKDLNPTISIFFIFMCWPLDRIETLCGYTIDKCAPQEQ
jgi:hypothetical protein